MSPRKITRLAVYMGAISVIGALVMLVWQPDIGILIWWPAAGLMLGVGLIVIALLRGLLMTVEARVAMNDALNLCYLGEQEREEQA